MRWFYDDGCNRSMKQLEARLILGGCTQEIKTITDNTVDLILAMREQGWLWTEEFIWHKKFIPWKMAQPFSRFVGTLIAIQQNAQVQYVSRRSDVSDGRLGNPSA